MHVTLRAATSADLGAVTEVLMCCWRENIASVAPASAIAAITPERVATLWSQALDGMESGAALVAESDSGTVVGITRYQRVPDGAGVVDSLYVSPRAQRLGIGARLLAAAVRGLGELGATRMTLWVLAANTPSIAFYRAQGWIPDGSTRVQPEFGVDEIRLEYAAAQPVPPPFSSTGEHSADDRLTGAARALVDSGPNAPAGVAIGLRTAAGKLTGVAGSRTAGDNALPMASDTSHDLASVTKILATTTALIGLVSAGDVRLDDPVRRYLPGFCGGGKDDVTIRHLLTHRGGLWEWQPLYLGGRTAEAALRYIERLPLRYEPDTARHYSDLGFMLLGRIIEIACGCRLETAVRNLVTKPLGLDSTGFAARHAAAAGDLDPDNPPAAADTAASAIGDITEQRMVATGEPYPIVDTGSGFESWRTHPLIGEVNDGNAHHVFGGVSGHAGLFSTLGDLLAFGAALTAYRDHDTMWRRSVVETFLSAGPDPEQALGFRRYRLTIDGISTIVYGHPGFVGCAVGFSPDAGLALALCSNRLLTAGQPVPTQVLWSGAGEAAAQRLAHGREVSPLLPINEADHD